MNRVKVLKERERAHSSKARDDSRHHGESAKGLGKGDKS